MTLAERIDRMTMKGIGYKSIAHNLGLSEKRVRELHFEYKIHEILPFMPKGSPFVAALRKIQDQRTKEPDEMPIKPHIIVRKDGIWLKMPYNKPGLAQLKETIPYKKRKWSPNDKYWKLSADPETFKLAKKVLQDHFNDYKVYNHTGDPQPTFDTVINTTSYYSILKVKPDASQKEIKRAYRKIIVKVHPDRTGDEETEYFHLVQKAYETLSNPRKRKRYDLAYRLVHNKGDTGKKP